MLARNTIILLFSDDFEVFFSNGCFPKWINFKVDIICIHAPPPSPVGKYFMCVFAAVEGVLCLRKILANLATTQGDQNPGFSTEIICCIQTYESALNHLHAFPFFSIHILA